MLNPVAGGEDAAGGTSGRKSSTRTPRSGESRRPGRARGSGGRRPRDDHVGGDLLPSLEPTPRTSPFPGNSSAARPRRTRIPSLSITALSSSLRGDRADGEGGEEEFRDQNVGSAGMDGPGDLQPEEPASEDDDPRMRALVLEDAIGVVERPQHENAVPPPPERGEEGRGPVGQQEGVEGDRGRPRRSPPLPRPVNAGHGRDKRDFDPVLSFHFSGNANSLEGQAPGEVFDQVRPGIIRMSFRGEEVDLRPVVELPERLGGHGPGQAVPDDDDLSWKRARPAEGIPVTRFLEILLAHAALGTDPVLRQVFEGRSGRDPVVGSPAAGS